MGAVDFVTKPGGTVSLNIKQVAGELVAKVRSAGRHAKIKRLRRRSAGPLLQPRPGPPTARVAKAAKPVAARPGAAKLVMIGVSTGGPSTLENILPLLPPDFPTPVLVAQHMPSNFTRLFAERLDGLCHLRVQEVQHRARLEPGNIYIAQGDADVEVSNLGVGLVATTVAESDTYLWHPSVDRMVKSAMACVRPELLVGVLLTGMGNDGAENLTEAHARGAHTIAESEDTAIIFGMPAELIAKGGAEVVLPNGTIAQQLIDWVCKGLEHGTQETRRR
jgi:two-component system chemotaxis response regulator CheB